MLSSILIRRMKIITKIRSIFGFYWYSGESKILKFLLYGYCVFCFLIVGIFFRLLFISQVYYSQFNNALYLLYLSLLEYIINCVTALILKGKFLNKLFSLINLTRSILNVKYVSVSKKMYIFLFIYIASKLSEIIFLFVQSEISDNNIHLCIKLFITFALCVRYISSILVFDVLYHQMKLVRRNLVGRHTFVNVISNHETRSNRKRNIEKSLLVYECLVTFVEDLDHELHIWFITMLLIYFLKCITYFYKTLLSIFQEQLLNVVVLIRINAVVFFFALSCLPIILFELTRNEVENIKDYLSNSALAENDKELIVELLRALEYIKLRPFELRIYRALPFDMSLILNFMSLIVTYVIIMAQFNS